jgi:hypothetical protein
VIGLVLHDAAGVPVFGTNTRFETPSNMPPRLDCGTVQVDISAECLRPGIYYISLWLADHYQDYCHLDRVLHVERKDASSNDLRPPRQTIGSVVLPTLWHYKAAAPKTVPRTTVRSTG